MEQKNSFNFFANRDCPYFPCHEKGNPEAFNCLFCYCPLYALGDRCGGNFQYTARGIKDCSSCTIPPSPAGYDYIIERFEQICELARKKPSE